MSQQVIFLVLRRMRSPLIALIIVYAIASFGLTLIPGIDPDGNPWKMSFFHAFYFVSFMGSTIGFGEIPHPFTDTQRYWVLAFIYITVIVWLYTIGTLLALIQDPAFRHAVTFQRFSRAVSRIDSAFYIVCGYGDTGRTLTKDLTALGFKVVVLDTDSDTISEIQLNEYSSNVLSLTCDMTIPENLINAGLHSKYCQAIVALSNDDHANLKVAVSSKSLNPSLITVCRAADRDEITNLRSFHTDVIVNPNELFAARLIYGIENPSGETMVNWLNSQNYLSNPQINKTKPIPNGSWIICGFGKFGETIKSYMDAEGIPNVVIAKKASCGSFPEGAIEGNGTDAPTLEDAGIHDAVGLIAGTPDDANNLSILLTAQQLNSQLFTIGRLNEQFNEQVFNSAQPDLIFRDNAVMANAILTRLTRPLVTNFIQELNKYSTAETDELLNSIKHLEPDNNPNLITWRTTISSQHTPAVAQKISQGCDISLKTLCVDIRGHNIHKETKTAEESEFPKQIKCLLLERDGSKQIEPTDDTLLELGDKLLFCGAQAAANKQSWTYQNIELLDNFLDPNLHQIPLLRWLSRKKER